MERFLRTIQITNFLWGPAKNAGQLQNPEFRFDVFFAHQELCLATSRDAQNNCWGGNLPQSKHASLQCSFELPGQSGNLSKCLMAWLWHIHIAKIWGWLSHAFGFSWKSCIITQIVLKFKVLQCWCWTNGSCERLIWMVIHCSVLWRWWGLKRFPFWRCLARWCKTRFWYEHKLDLKKLTIPGLGILRLPKAVSLFWCVIHLGFSWVLSLKIECWYTYSCGASQILGISLGTILFLSLAILHRYRHPVTQTIAFDPTSCQQPVGKPVPEFDSHSDHSPLRPHRWDCVARFFQRLHVSLRLGQSILNITYYRYRHVSNLESIILGINMTFDLGMNHGIQLWVVLLFLRMSSKTCLKPHLRQQSLSRTTPANIQHLQCIVLIGTPLAHPVKHWKRIWLRFTVTNLDKVFYSSRSAFIRGGFYQTHCQLHQFFDSVSIEQSEWSRDIRDLGEDIHKLRRPHQHWFLANWLKDFISKQIGVT